MLPGSVIHGVRARCMAIVMGWVLALGGGQVWASSLASVQLVMDGSVKPPGDLIQVWLWTEPKALAEKITVRAFLVSGEQQEQVTRVPARTARHGNAEGHFELVVEQAGTTRKELTLARIVVPFDEMAIPPGTHKLGYELTCAVNDQVQWVTATELTEVTVSDKDRTSMRQVTARLSEELQTRRQTVFVGGRPPAEVANGLKPRSVEVVKRRAVRVVETKDVAVSIPGGYERRRIPTNLEVKKPDAESPGSLPDLPTDQPWQPSADVRDVAERRVYYITNRVLDARRQAAAPTNGDGDAGSQENNVAEPNPNQAATAPQFGTDVDADLHFGSCLVSIPVHVHRRGHLELPSWWIKADPKTVFRVDEVRATSGEGFLRDADEGDVLLFVHGFNNSFDDAILRAAQLAYDLEFPGRVATFCWPSHGDFTKYAPDAEHAAASATALADALRVLLKNVTSGESKSERRVHIMAHSMGNRIVLNALYALSRDPIGGRSDRPFGQIVLAAPDVGAAQFNNLVDHAIRASAQTTYYFCRRDAALKLSQDLNKYEPVGMYPYFQAGLVTIDADNVDTSFMWHSYYSSSVQVLADLNLVFTRALAPEERMPPLTGREQVFGHDYWVFGTDATMTTLAP